MSDEEKRGELYVRHQPSYRSDVLNAFIKKLDKRSAASSTSHAKFQCIIGTPTKKTVPPPAKRWIVKPMSDIDASEAAGVGMEENQTGERTGIDSGNGELNAQQQEQQPNSNSLIDSESDSEEF